MKFTTVAIAASALGAVVAAPATASGIPAGLPASATKFDGVAQGIIDCTVDKKICSVTCGEGLQLLCTLVAVFDSVFYGIEVLAGFTIDCTDKGCNVYCPVEGTALCTINEAGATFDAVFAVGETIIISGIEDLLGGVTNLNTPQTPPF